MAGKESGLGDNLYVGGYDLSGDTGSLGNIGGGPAALELTGIDKSAFERVGGSRDGRIEWSSWFNTLGAHPVLSALPTADVHVMYCRGTTLGCPAACLVSKLPDYPGQRGNDGSFTFGLSAQANGYGLEWGQLLTAGLRTDTAAANGTGVSFWDPGFLSLPGTAGDCASTPDAAALDITGDIDLRARVTATDWTPAADGCAIGKHLTTGNQRSYALVLTSAGKISLLWSTNGTAESSATSTVATGLADGTVQWIRGTLDVNNGAGNAIARFYVSPDNVTWSQLGADVAVGSTTSIYAGTATLFLGARGSGTTDNLVGRVWEAEVRNGIDGTIVAQPKAYLSGITDPTGLAWTVNGTAKLATPGLRGFLQVTEFSGTDATVTIQESTDNGGTDAWANLVSFTAVSAAHTTQRVAVPSTTAAERYLRVVTTTAGGFTNLKFAVAVCRNGEAF